MKIVLLTKSPVPKRGRIGKYEDQDWYRSCEEAAWLLKEMRAIGDQTAKILVPTMVQMDKCLPEGAVYAHALIRLGLKPDDFEIVSQGHETIEQVEYGLGLMEQDGAVTFVSTLLHFPRIWWLCFRSNRDGTIDHIVVGGLPRPREALTDLALVFLFPVIDLFGGRNWFQEWVIARRKAGKL